MELTLNEIYTHYNNLKGAFEGQEIYFPLKFIYTIYKNKKELESFIRDIELFKIQIVKKYGSIEGDKWFIKNENMEQAQNELNDFLETKEKVEIIFIKINELPQDIKLTGTQMNAIMFMLEE